MQVVIDPHSGFCGGVVRAIRLAEKESSTKGQLYCLGEIVHNQAEINRLSKNGLKFINHEEFEKLKNARVLIRAHGEAPDTYRLAEKNNIELIDATCQVVKRLQHKIKNAAEEMREFNGQVVVFGKEDHPEVISLKGQAVSDVVIIKNKDELSKIDFSRPVRLFAQTTKSVRALEEIEQLIQKRLNGKGKNFISEKSICKQVSSREEMLILFARDHDVIVFVGGEKSSNAKFLFGICKAQNSNSYFINNEEGVNSDWFKLAKSVGISGATSTPRWLMEKVAEKINAL